jgi:hypothetical protein
MKEDTIGCLIFTIISFFVIVGLVLLTMIHFSSIGVGEHNGYITAIDQNGYIFRNYDIYFKTDNSSSQEDKYCINRNNLDLIKKANEVNKARKQVVIQYEGVRGLGWDLCSYSEIKNIQLK